MCFHFLTASVSCVTLPKIPAVTASVCCPVAAVIIVSCHAQLGKGKRNFSKLQRQVDTQREKRELSERERKELNEIKRLIPDRLSDPLLDVGMHMALGTANSWAMALRHTSA